MIYIVDPFFETEKGEELIENNGLRIEISLVVLESVFDHSDHLSFCAQKFTINLFIVLA